MVNPTVGKMVKYESNVKVILTDERVIEGVLRQANQGFITLDTLDSNVYVLPLHRIRGIVLGKEEAERLFDINEKDNK